MAAIESDYVGGYHMNILRDSAAMNRYAAAYKTILLEIRAFDGTGTVNATRDLSEAHERQGRIARFKMAMLNSCQALRLDSSTSQRKL